MNDPRKQPRQARSRATVDAIVEAAARILTEDGPRSLTTNRIAARAGVSVGSLYQYFPNRPAIVRALAEREIERAEARRPPAIDDPTLPPWERLRAVVDWHFDVHGSRPGLSRALLALGAGAVPRAQLVALARLRSERTARTVASLREHSETEDRSMAPFVVEVCLEALARATTTRHPSWLRSARFRSDVTRLLGLYLGLRAPRGRFARRTAAGIECRGSAG